MAVNRRAPLSSRNESEQTKILRQLVEQHSQDVFRLAWRMVGNESDAEEVVQETFLRAWRGLDRFRGQASQSTWLYRIATNCALDLLRKRKRQDVAEPVSLEDSAPDDKPDPEKRFYHGQIRQKVERVMDKMAPKERSAFALRHFAECSVKEISDILGIKPNAVKQAIFRAVGKLRAGLELK